MISDAFLDLTDDEPLRGLRHVRDRLYTATAAGGWSEVCRWASTLEGGQWWPKERGLTWANGTRATWIVTADQVPEIEAAHGICQGLGLACGWSVGSAARALLRYVGPPQYHYRSSLALKAETSGGYLECHPGEYDDSVLWDCKGYYYTLLTRMPTWRLTIRSDARLVMHGNYPGEEDRRHRVLQLVAPYKLLRNALVGCMTGREEGAVYYHQGKRKRHKGGPGLFRGAGLLIRRTGWELARAAAVEVESKLSNTDCVLCTGGLYPATWADYGLVVEPRLEGQAEVCSPIIWRVGAKGTKFYDQGSRFRESFPRPPAPTRLYTGAWLSRVG